MSPEDNCGCNVLTFSLKKWFNKSLQLLFGFLLAQKRLRWSISEASLALSPLPVENWHPFDFFLQL